MKFQNIIIILIMMIKYINNVIKYAKSVFKMGTKLIINVMNVSVDKYISI